MNVLILGANGQIARYAIDLFLKDTNAKLTLYLRKADRLKRYKSDNVDVIEGDVLDYETLKQAMAGQDIVYANLDGRMDEHAENIVKAMKETNVKRLIFVGAYAIYDEVPGEFGRWNKQVIGAFLGPYRMAADIIEDSDVDYTFIRPPWLINDNEIEYETTDKSELFQGTVVSRKSVASLVVDIAENPELYLRKNIGINKPGSVPRDVKGFT
ncbi:SDR family oxidoreductase [Virgibacillus sp. NKC19-16]|uniref:SDR family oxidoreductase n=1 Tax=Virgibacillus salidurans TaxID=2831673 RepID=UPI001F181287|nr:SDR family oxidoreductase [Virgibacillus sp. NKC19-16]UJL46047.1 SDR family oxidoreductase [Virgibacillus sp. NKC19-16]